MLVVVSFGQPRRFGVDLFIYRNDSSRLLFIRMCLIFRNPNGVPIGQELAETKFYIKTESKLVDVAECLLNNGSAEGCLLHFSETRKCYVNFARDQMVDSGDLALLAGDGKIYIKGRLNRSGKINGKLLNLNLMDNVNKLNKLWVNF